jgi:hypothetical protein
MSAFHPEPKRSTDPSLGISSWTEAEDPLSFARARILATLTNGRKGANLVIRRGGT